MSIIGYIKVGSFKYVYNIIISDNFPTNFNKVLKDYLISVLICIFELKLKNALRK